MEKVFVPILKKSIRKNPRAFKTSTTVSTGRSVSFVVRDVPAIPEFLNNPKIAFITATTQSSDGTQTWYDVEGELIDPGYIDKFKEIEGATISVENHHQTYRHLPEPEYLYKYKNIKVECSHCHSKVPINAIISDYDYDGEDEHYYEQCPVCERLNTFPERQYEKLEAAVSS